MMRAVIEMIQKDKILLILSLFVLIWSGVAYLLGLQLQLLYAGIGFTTLGVHMKQFSKRTKLNYTIMTISFLVGLLSIILYVFN